MKRESSPLGAVLRITCLALAIQFFAGVLADLGDPYMPFVFIVFVYLIAAGVPLLILLLLTAWYCRRRRERLWPGGKAGLPALLTWSFPLSWLIRLCVGLVITGQSRQTFWAESLRALPLYLICGAVCFALSKSVKRRKAN